MHGMQKRSDWFYPTAFSSWDDQEYAAIQRVVDRKRFTMGEETEAFESEFANYHQMKHGIMVNSGSSANLIMIAALMQKKDNPLQRWNSVLVPALAWGTTYAPVIQHGLRIRLMDCDNTWCFGHQNFDDAKCAIGVSILGVPATHMRALQIAMTQRGGYLLEDNCEALGAAHQGRPTGTRGIMNSFSFFYSHQLSAVEGGMILTDDDECARLCRILRDHGNTRSVEPPTDFNKEYNFTHFGYNVRPIEMHAAVARVQLKKLNDFMLIRRANLRKFVELTKGMPIKHQETKGLLTSPFGMAFTVESMAVRYKAAAALRSADIDCRLPTGGSFSKHPYGKRWGDIYDTPMADRIHFTGLFIGNAPYQIDEQIERAADVLGKVLQ